MTGVTNNVICFTLLLIFIGVTVFISNLSAGTVGSEYSLFLEFTLNFNCIDDLISSFKPPVI